MRKVILPFGDDALVMLSEECGHEDGKIGARFKPPSPENELAVSAYGHDYWKAVACGKTPAQMEPNRRIVRRARSIAAHKRRRYARSSAI